MEYQYLSNTIDELKYLLEMLYNGVVDREEFSSIAKELDEAEKYIKRIRTLIGAGKPVEASKAEQIMDEINAIKDKIEELEKRISKIEAETELT